MAHWKHASPSEHNDEDAADEEEEVAVQHGVEEDEDGDAGQQDRRASHAQASTRGGGEAMPDGTPAAGVLPLAFMLTTLPSFKRISGMSRLVEVVLRCT